MTIDRVIDNMAAAEAQAGKPAAENKNNQVNKETFMRLLVAQIKHQNPLNPADGAQFLSQLAQFSELEQMLEIRNELAALRTDMAAKNTGKETSEPKNV
jgi:flagellar basal-body rod modification protein FlgD